MAARKALSEVVASVHQLGLPPLWQHDSLGHRPASRAALSAFRPSPPAQWRCDPDPRDLGVLRALSIPACLPSD